MDDADLEFLDEDLPEESSESSKAHRVGTTPPLVGSKYIRRPHRCSILRKKDSGEEGSKNVDYELSSWSRRISKPFARSPTVVSTQREPNSPADSCAGDLKTQESLSKVDNGINSDSHRGRSHPDRQGMSLPCPGFLCLTARLLAWRVTREDLPKEGKISCSEHVRKSKKRLKK